MGTRSSLAKLAKEIYPGLDAIDENVVSLDDNNAFGATTTASFGKVDIAGRTTMGNNAGGNVIINGITAINQNTTIDSWVSIGSSPPTHPLDVWGDVVVSGDNAKISGSATSTGSFGTVQATHFTGDGAGLTNVPDYVFESDYDLKSLSYVETFVSESFHLPNVPGRDDLEGWKSYDVGARDMLLLEKIEELTLYVIRLEKRVKELENN